MNPPTNTRRPLIVVALAIVAAIVCLAVFTPHDAGFYLPIAFGMAIAFGLKDADLSVTKALPNGAASVSTDGIDTEADPDNGNFVAPCELLLEIPDLAVGELANGETITYDVEHDSDSAFGTAETLAGSVHVQTGAGGVGDVGADVRVRLPSTVKQYVRVTATKTGATGDASTATLTVSLVF